MNINTKAVEALREIIKGNKSFTENHRSDYFSGHMSSQHPFITLVSCSDSRVQPSVLLPDAIDKIFTVENIGNQILVNEGSVDYGIYHLHTPVLLVMGHSDCGAIKAYMKGYQNEHDSIRKELDFLKQAFAKCEQTDDFEKDLLKYIRANIDYQVSVGIEKYSKLIEQNELTIVGCYYDFNNDFGQGFGKVIFLNVNGEKKENIDINF